MKFNKATQLLKPVIDHLSLVFKTGADGKEWGPRNTEAIVLGTKGAPIEGAPTFNLAPTFDQIAQRKKAWYTDGPVVGDVDDNIDGDGDGASDYNAIVALIYQMYCDLQSGTWINDDEARSAAVTIVIDNFLAELDKIRGGDETGGAGAKAGARHSKSDKEHLKGIADANKQIGDHLAALGAGDDSKTEDEPEPTEDEKAKAVKALAQWTPGDIGDDGLPANYAELEALIGKAKAKDDKKSKEPYGDVEYADPGYQEDKKKRYPIDTKAHAKAAWSYINKEKNASKYSAEDLKKVKDNIKAACKKFGIEIEEDKAAPAPAAAGVTQAQLDDAIAKAVADAKAAAKKEAEAALATAAEETRKAKERAEEAERKVAARPSATAVASAAHAAPVPTEKGTGIDPNSRLQRAIKAQLGINAEPMVMGRN